MDPLSITAGIVAVIQAANAIISLCYDYRAALEDQPWSLNQTLSQVQDLRSTLERFEALACKAKQSSGGDSFFNGSLFGSEDGCLTRCEQELGKLQQLITPSKLVAAPGSHRNALVTVFKWKVKDREVSRYLERIEQLKSTLDLELGTATASVMLDIHESTTVTKEGLGALNAEVKEVHNHLNEETLAKEQAQRMSLIEQLCPIDVVRKQASAFEKCTSGTTDWLLCSEQFRRFQSWGDRILWINGGTGTGKTVLFASLVERLCLDVNDCEDELLAHFYCDFRDESSRNPASVAAALVGQLCKRASIIPAPLQPLLPDAGFGSSVRDKIDMALTDLAIGSFAKQWKVTLLVDAVDEVEDSSQLAAFLVQLQRLPNVRVLVTSRDEHGLRCQLCNCKQITLSDFKDVIYLDIETYIRDRLASDPRLNSLSERVKQDIESELKAKSEGMFRWVQCQLDAIKTMRTVKQIRQGLKSLPLGLHETYRAILRRVLPYDQVFVCKILRWLSFTVLPLSLEQLHEAIAIQPDSQCIDDEDRLASVDDVLALCGSLVTVNSAGIVSLAHMSVKDFLLSEAISQDVSTQCFAMNKEQANLELALTCLNYLSFQEFSQGPSTSALSYAARIARHPLAKHAAVSWPYYVRIASKSLQSSSNDRFASFFEQEERSAFMSWVQILNADCDSEWNLYPTNATSLYYAASFGLDGIAQRLIENGAPLDVPGSRFGGTALHAAVLRGHEKVVRLLLHAGADVNQADCYLISPLHTATARGNMPLIALLLDHGASIEAEDSRGDTPLDWGFALLPPQKYDQLLRLSDRELESRSIMKRQGYACSWSVEEAEQVLQLPVKLLRLKFED